MRKVLLPGLLFVGVAGAASSAKAITVECESADGTCTVSNEPDDFSSCACGDEGGTSGTGGSDWADLTEKELMDICLGELEFCGPGEGSTSVGTSVGTVSDTDSTSTTDATTGLDTGTSASETGTGSTDTDASTTGAEGSTSGGSEETGSGTTGTASDTEATSDASATDATDASASASASATDASASGPSSDTAEDTSGSATAGGDDDDGGGCRCNASGGDRSGILGLGLLAMVGLRRRRR